jgi:hypothetical protein
MTTEKRTGSNVWIRGHGSYIRRASRTKRALAVATDLPIHFLAPFISVFFFNQPPLPELWIIGLWLAWSGLVHFGPKHLLGTTVGGWIWGIRTFEDRGTLESASGFTIRFSSWVLLGVSLYVSTLMLQTTLMFHPMLQRAPIVEIPAFSPPESEDKLWTELSFYFATGSFPRQIEGEAVWYLLPYGKGPPGHFPPLVVSRLPRERGRLLIEGPRTPGALRNKRELIRNCLASRAPDLRLSPECLQVRRELLRRHTTDMLPSGKSPTTWEIAWFEVAAAPGSPPLRGAELPMGVRLTAKSGTELVHRFILINARGQQQVISLESRATPESVQGDLPLLEKIIGGLVLHDTLDRPLAWVNHRLSLTNFGTIRGGGKLDKLSHAAALLISKATVDPGDPDTYFELAGVSLVMLKRAGRGLDSETVGSVSRPQAFAAQKFMRDVAADDPRNRQLEQMLLDLKGF